MYKLAHIVIPNNVIRNKFIQTCLYKKTVSVMLNNGTIRNDVRVSKESFNYVKFPSTGEKLGSSVGCVEVEDGSLLVIGVFDDKNDFENRDKDSFLFEKNLESTSARISGNGGTGEIFLSVNNFNKDNLDTSNLQEDQIDEIKKKSIGSKIQIDVKDVNNKGQFILNIQGDCIIESDSNIQIKASKAMNLIVKDEGSTDENTKDLETSFTYQNGGFNHTIYTVDADGKQLELKTQIKYTTKEGLYYKDEFNNELSFKDGEISVISEKIVLSKGDEAMVLGNKLKSFMNDFITAVSNITTVTMLGTQPIINKAQVEALRKNLDLFLSKNGFLK